MSAVVHVEPSEFRLVDFDPAEIARVVADVAERIGLAAVAIQVQVNERTPLGRARLGRVTPDEVVLEVESGGFEDPLRPRQMSERNVAATAGRLLMLARDRLDPAFGDPPADHELSLAESVAWDVYATGRLARLGYPSQEDRRRYHFRIRHGFTDAADAAFDRLWAGEGLTWDDVSGSSAFVGT